MHMADALLSPQVGLAMDVISFAALGVTVAKTKKNGGIDIENKVPLMGVAGALVFAGQMINFAIPATGSSGHIGGGILLAALLGGVPAFLALSAVLIIQCLFFADGGLLALGCNIFNMGVIPCLIVYPLVFKPLTIDIKSGKRLTLASIVSVMVGLELGALCVVVETFASGITALPFGTFTALMLPIHLAIGLVEGLVTAGILAFVHQTRPEILTSAVTGTQMGRVSLKKTIAVLTVMTVVIGGGLSLFASSHPDGLEWSIEKITGSTELESESSFAAVQEKTAFLPDYALPSNPESAVGTTVSGLAGAGITFALAVAAGLVIKAVKKKQRNV